MKTEISNVVEENVLTFGFSDGLGEYFMWQVNIDDKSEIHFEYNDQINSGYNNVKEITAMKDGIHVITSADKMLHFYFNGLNDNDYSVIIDRLKQIYSNSPNILEIH